MVNDLNGLPSFIAHCYHPCMRVGNVFGHVSVCLSVFLSVQAITFESLDIETSFLVCRYIVTISRSSFSIKVKVTHQGQGHIKVKVKYLHPFKFYATRTLFKGVVCI